ncbi:MAG: hypothetical protein M3R72_05290 [Bacteroidota bacterium]|nr:hypothetical protein [Bacteroidota bacterium]
MTTVLKSEQNIYQTLRIATAMCFIGHGSFGVITKPIWCNYFAVFGIGHHLAYQLMPVLGTVDILMGLMMLVYPVRFIAGWLVFWGIITALLRPLSGEPFAEFLERAGNFGAPLALLLLVGNGKNARDWFAHIKPDIVLDAKTIAKVSVCLRTIVFLLLAGHGWLNLIAKKGLLDQYTSLGFSNPAGTAYIIGVAEMLMAFLTLIRPLRPFVFAFFLWKMASELLYPHHEIFEWIERGGSYGTLLALYFCLQKTPSQNTSLAFT